MAKLTTIFHSTQPTLHSLNYYKPMVIRQLCSESCILAITPKALMSFRFCPIKATITTLILLLKRSPKKLIGYVTDLITDITLNWLKNERDPEKPFFLAYLHKAPHREWIPAERHYKEFIHKTFPEPSTLFDNYEGRGTAAKEAEMNLLHMNWAGDSKIFPENMKKLGIKESHSYDIALYMVRLVV
jgi:hypothetical protein